MPLLRPHPKLTMMMIFTKKKLRAHAGQDAAGVYLTKESEKSFNYTRFTLITLEMKKLTKDIRS